MNTRAVERVLIATLVLACTTTRAADCAKIAETCVEAFANDKIKAMHETYGIPNGPVGLAEARQRWKDEAPQWVALADRLGIKLD